MLFASTDGGDATSTVDLNNMFHICWPSQISCKYSSSFSEVEVYISEYLGRIWKITFQIDSSGNILLEYNSLLLFIISLLID